MSQPLSDPSTPNRPGGRIPLYIGIGLVAVLVLGVIAWTQLRTDAPEAANLDAATAELTDDSETEAGEETDADADAAANTTESTESDDGDTADDDADEDATDDADDADAGDADAAATDEGSDTDDPAIDDVSGDWTVDTSIGEFSFEDSTGTYVGFRVGEELTSVGVTEAVGRTPEVTGTVSIDGQTVTATSIEADMTALTTDVSRRDGAARRALETDSFPTAGFVLTEPIDLGADPASGAPVSATAVGDLTVHGVTNPVEVAIDAQLVGDTIAIVGSTDVVFADYGVTPPSAPVVVSLDDFGIIEFQLFLTRS